MADIDQLHFEAILDDKEFNQRIEADISAAKKLNTDLSKLVNIRMGGGKRIISDADISAARAMADALSNIKIQVESIPNGGQALTNTKEIEKVLQQILAKLGEMPGKAKQTEAGFRQVNNELSRSSNLMSDFARLAGVTFGIAGARRFISSLVEISGQFEVQKMALTSMLQSADKANELFETLQQNALKSPYTFQDLTKFSKQLIAFNIDADKLVDTEKRLADVAAGLGVDMGRIILAYGQVKAAGALKGQELRQFTEAGVPILQELARQIEETEGKAISLAEVFQRISKKQIPFEMVEEAFVRMTSEGGKFYNMQEVLVETLAGKIGKLRDVWQQMLYAMGQQNSGILKGTVDSLTWFVQNLNKIGLLLKPIIIGFGAYAAILGVVAIKQAAVAGTAALANFMMLLKYVRSLRDAMLLLEMTASGAAIAIGAIAAVGLGVVALVRHFNRANKELDEFKRSLDDVSKSTLASSTSEARAQVEQIKKLSEVAHDEARANNERAAALAKLREVVPGYLGELDHEGRVIKDNTSKIQAYTDAIIKEAEAKGHEQLITQLTAQKDQLLLDKKLLEEKRDEAKRRTTTFVGNTPAYAAFVPGGAIGPVTGALKSEEDKLDAAVEEYENKITEVDKRIKTSQDILLESIFNTPAPTWGPNTKPSKEMTQAEKDARNYIEILQKARAAYESLSKEELIGIGNAQKIISNLFPEIEAKKFNFDFEKEIRRAAGELAQFGEDSKNFGENIIAGLSKDKAKDILDLVRAFAKLKEARDKLEGQDFDVSGKSAIADLNKAIVDYNNKVAEVERKRLKNIKLVAETQTDDEQQMAILRETLGEEVWNEYVKNGEKAFNLLADKEKESLRRAAQQRIDNIAKTYFKDLTDQLNMQDWGDKTYQQVKDIFDKLGQIQVKGIAEIPEELTEKIKEGKFSLEDFFQTYNRLFADAKKNVSDELLKKTVDRGQKLVSVVGQVGDAFKRWGDSLGEDVLSILGEALSMLDEIGRDMMDIMKDTKSLLSSSDLVDGVESASKQAVKSAEELKDALNLHESIDTEDLENLAESLDGAADASKEISENMSEAEDAAGDAGDALNGLINSASEITMIVKIILMAVNSIVNAVQSGEETARRAREAVWEAVKAAREAKTIMSETIVGDSWTKRISAEAENFKQAAAEYMDMLTRYELYARNNPIHEVARNWNNEEFLVNYYDELKKYYDEYIKWSQAFSDSVEQIFGDLASSIADQMVDAFVRTGDAMTDLSDSFNDLKKVIYKTFAQDILVDWFKNSGYIQQLTELTRQYAVGDIGEVDYAARLNETLGEIQDILTSRVDLINQIGEALGLANVEAEKADSASLGKGIQSITEDTANLLASYINAMRADLSYIRLMQEGGWQDVKAIREAVSLGQVPNYNEYMAQIAANTFDTAQATNNILLELRSVIGSGAAPGAGVRVYIQ